MKNKWAYKQNGSDEKSAMAVPVPMEIVGLKCVGCGDGAEMLFQGTSYCESCLKERVRTGTA